MIGDYILHRLDNLRSDVNSTIMEISNILNILTRHNLIFKELNARVKELEDRIFALEAKNGKI